MVTGPKKTSIFIPDIAPVIAVDAMGGDNAPGDIVRGALAAAKQQISIKLFGPRMVLKKLLDECELGWEQYPLMVCDAPDAIGMGENPVAAVQSKAQSSLVQAVFCVKNGHASAVLSAGSSGALYAASLLILGRSGQARPGIVGFLPAKKERVLALDLGANVDCRAQHLYEFAYMARDFALSEFKKESPRIGLLSNGQEDSKGSRLTKDAFVLLKSGSDINFIGNVEPDAIFNNHVDIVICDGFSGNILLKTMETIYTLFSDLLVQESLHSENIYINTWCKKFLAECSQACDSRKQGGALLLGINGRVIVCHGSSDAYAIERAIMLAAHGNRALFS